MNVLVCGGRAYSDREHAFWVLDSWLTELGDFTVIEGGALGADYLAREWAIARGLPFREFKADWLGGPNRSYDPGAGPKRNQQMLDEAQPALVIAFPGGSGTHDMVERAKRAKVQVALVVPRAAFA